jgi:hypothetical protein
VRASRPTDAPRRRTDDVILDAFFRASVPAIEELVTRGASPELDAQARQKIVDALETGPRGAPCDLLGAVLAVGIKRLNGDAATLS